LRSNFDSITRCGVVGEDAVVYTDEYDNYNALKRTRFTVAHGKHEWARDEEGDECFNTHSNTIEGAWTGLQNFLRPFRGVNKYYLYGYVAIYERRVNYKTSSPSLILYMRLWLFLFTSFACLLL
jgi:transposase-like protein